MRTPWFHRRVSTFTFSPPSSSSFLISVHFRSFPAWLLAAGFLLSSPSASRLWAGDWPQWRGPDGNSVSREVNLPLNWTTQRGVIWKTDLPEWGDSTPAIWGDAIYITTQHDDKLLLLKLDKPSGRIVWSKTVGSGLAARGPQEQKTPDERRQQRFHVLQNLASPSPVTDGRVVVVHFGNGDLAAYDPDGQQLWHRNLQTDYGSYTIWWGHANSPAIWHKSLIDVCMQDSLADFAKRPVESYLVAHDLMTGADRWKTPRMTGAHAESCDSYTTPLFAQIDGQTQMIVMGADQLDAYDPDGGQQIWFLPKIHGARTVTGPTVADGMVFVTLGNKGAMLAVKPHGHGELPRSSIVWQYKEGTPDTCCPVVWGDHLFFVSDAGIARCLDIHTGRALWNERLKGEYKASPVAAEGRIYFLNTHGLCTVISASDRFEKLAENQLEDETLASPAISDGHIFIRGRKSLFCRGRDF